MAGEIPTLYKGQALLKRAIFATGLLIAVVATAVAQERPQPPGSVGPRPQGAGGGSGPSCHQVQMASSTDGLIFVAQDKPLLEQASVPDGIVFGGMLMFYYVNGGQEHGMFRALPGANGWQRGDKVLLDGQFNPNAVDPDVVMLPDGRMRLFYYVGQFVGPPVDGAAGKDSPFFAAVSDDGVNFTVEGQVFQAPDATDPSAVLLPDGSWLLAVAQARERKILLARSADGMTFMQFAEVDGVGIPELVLDPEGNVRLFYNGNGGIESLRSADGGVSWEVEPGLRLKWQGLAADPSMVAMGEGVWALFVKTIIPNCSGPEAGAQQGGGRAGGGGGFSAALPEGLNLSEDQQAQIEEAIAAARQEIGALRQQGMEDQEIQRRFAEALNQVLMTVMTDAQKEIYAAAQQQPNAADAGAVQPAGGVGGRP